MKNWWIKLQLLPLELIFWCLTLVGLWWMDPFANHFSLCILDQFGINWCPGCGLGRSMALLMKGELSASWEKHPLAGFAFLVIIYRIIEIIQHLKTTHNYG
jgi:hypothetical protein